MNDNINKSTSKNAKQYKKVLTDIVSTAYDKKSNTFDMTDDLAWASDDQIKAYNSLTSSDEKAKYMKSQIEAKYGTDNTYLNKSIDTTGMSGSDMTDVKEACSEMTMCSRATDAGYLSTLSDDDRTALLSNYMDWMDTHKQRDADGNPYYGKTDSDICDMSSDEQTAYSEKLTTTEEAWGKANSLDIITHMTDKDGNNKGANKLEDKAVSADAAAVYGTGHTDELVAAKTADNKKKADEKAKADKEAKTAKKEKTAEKEKTDTSDDSKSDTTSTGTGTWAKITATIGAVGAGLISTIKTIYDDKIEPWLESAGFIKSAEATASNESESDAKDTAKASDAESKKQKQSDAAAGLDDSSSDKTAQQAADADADAIVDNSDSDDQTSDEMGS